MNWESILFLISTVILALLGVKKGVNNKRDKIHKKYNDLRAANADSTELPKDPAPNAGSTTKVRTVRRGFKK